MTTTSTQLPPLPTTTSEVRITVDDQSALDKNTKGQTCLIASLGTLLLLLFSPFVILDFYVGYTDTSCVNQTVSNMSLTLKTWFLVNGYLSAIVLITCIVLFIYNMYTSNNLFDTVFLYIFNKLFTLFSLAWNITGAVLFWGMMDNDVCDKLTYDYMYTKLILSFVFIGFSICSGKKK